MPKPVGPGSPNLWNPIFTAGDHLHPNPLGIETIAASIPLSLLQP